MSRTLIAIVVGLGSFTLSLAGVYFAMPSLAPAVVEAAQETATTDSLASRDGQRADTLVTAPDSTDALFASSEDTVVVLRRRLRAAEQDAADRRALARDAEERLASLQARQAGASELSETLAELEDAELAAILRRLDLSVLRRLYAEANARNRKRLLKAMPAERAAYFVSQVVSADAADLQPATER